tara:strand:+ start:589 stop:1131 length:543 start_codon:yes stop_codon:yes gene_type:complete
MSERFWSQASVEPKRSFRWYMTLAGQSEQLETYAIKTVKKPSFTVSEVPHQFVAHTFYYPGRVTWNTVDVTFVDPVVPDQSLAITNMFVKAGYRVPKNEQIALSSFSKERFVVAVGTPVITQIDADGSTIEEWSLANCFFTNIDYGQLDYGSEDLVINSVTLRYDYATLDVANGNSLLTP